MFLGAAARPDGRPAAGFEITPPVAGPRASVVSATRLPLSALVLAVVLTSKSGLATGR
jgi:hypothetical protein